MSIFTRIGVFFGLLLCLGSQLAGAQVANFTGTPVSGCAPLVVQFTSTSTGNITGYQWQFNNSAPVSTLQNPSTTFTTPGTYTIVLTVTGPGGSNTKTSTNYITVYPQPSVSFTAQNNDTAGCPGKNVQFNSTVTPNAPGNATYNWDFGDGGNSQAANPSHIYYNSGFYNVTLVVTNGAGCSKTYQRLNYINIFAKPQASMSATGNYFCHAPATVGFTNTSTGAGPFTANWIWGDNSPNGQGNAVTHTYTNTGSFTVTLIVTDNKGCKDTSVQQGFINIVNVVPTFSSTSPICYSDSLHVTNTTSGPVAGSNIVWIWGDNTTPGSGQSAAHKYASAGTYTVRMARNYGPCNDTATQTVVVNPAPGGNFTWSPFLPCPSPVNVSFTAQNGSSYLWLFGDGTAPVTGNPVNHTFTRDSVYTVTLITTSAAGCRDTLRKIDSLNIYPMFLQAGALPGSGCAPLTVSFSSTLTSTKYFTVPVPFVQYINYPSPITSRSWSFGDNTPNSSQATPTHTYTNPGVYHPVLTVTTANGCTKTDTLEIRVGVKPTANFSVAANPLCTNQGVQFNNMSLNADSYQWLFGDSSSATDPNPLHFYQHPNTFTVTLIAFNNGCPDSMKKINVVRTKPPSAHFKDSLGCPPSKTVWLTNTSDSITSCIWYFGDNTTSTAVNPGTHTYPNFGLYQCMLVTFNNIYGCSDTEVHAIDIPNPQLSFTASDTTLCKGQFMTLNATFTGFAAPFGFGWRFDNKPNIIWDTAYTTFDSVFTVTGYHTVTFITADYNGCRDSITKVNYLQVAQPVANFNATPTVGCTPLNVNFTDLSSYTAGVPAANRYWEFGNGILNTASPTTSHLYPNAGIFDVKLIVTDIFGCKDSMLKTAYIDARRPVADFSVNDSTTCPGQLLSFTNNSTGSGTLSYSWNFGDNTPVSVQASPTHTYYQPGTYTVRLIVTDGSGCKDTLTKTGYIQITKPHAAFTLSDTLAICPPLLVSTTNTSTGAGSYEWNMGIGGPSYLTNPVATYNTPGIYNVRLIAIDAFGCTDTANRTVRVLGYSGLISYSPLLGCSPLTVNFTATNLNVASMIWDFNDGVTLPAAGLTTSHVYQTPGAYIPRLIFGDGLGCINSSYGIDTIKVDAVDAGFKVSQPCVKVGAQFTDTSKSLFSPVTQWSWTFDTPPASTISNPVHLYNTPGTYPVTLIVTNANGCKDTVQRNVTIYQLPVISAGADTTICLGDGAVLQPSGGISYTWTTDPTLSCTACTNPTASPTANTVYTVTGRDGHDCPNTDDVKVSLQTKTTFTTGPGGEICEEESYQLQASGAQLYNWSPAASLSGANTATPLARPKETTYYTVVAKEGSCAPDSSRVRVVVNLRPAIEATADPMTVIAGGTTTLQATGIRARNYLWLPDSTISCLNCPAPLATPRQTTKYYVVGISDKGCTDTAEVTVRVLCDNSQLFIPNTFTPNGDGQNDRFFPRGGGVQQIKSFRVYSRWGELLYERSALILNDEGGGWDGSFRGAELPPDVYVYVLEATCDNGDPILWKGDITLIR